MKVVDDPDLGPPAPFGPGGGDAADEEAEEDEVEDADADAAGG